MSSTFEIYTLGTGYFLEKVFNAIRVVMSGNAFVSLLKLGVIIGLLIKIVSSVFTFQVKSMILWFFQVTAITGVLLVPTADVWIVDELPDKYSMTGAARHVEKVPFGLAAMASVTSQAGHWLGQQFEGAFSTTFPNETYQKTGVLFGAKIIEDTMNLRSYDANLTSAFNTFYNSCLLPDLQMGLLRANGFTYQDIGETQDLIGFLATRSSKARQMVYDKIFEKFNTKNHKVANGYISCYTAANILKDKIDREAEISMPYLAKGFFAQFFPDDKSSNQEAVFRSTFKDSYAMFLGGGQDEKNLLMQNISINALNDSVGNAYSKSVIKKTTDVYFSSMASLASKFILNIKAAFEIMIYALFPIAVMLMLAPGGAAILKNYFLSLIYLQLWIPIYAILFTVFSEQYAALGTITEGLTYSSQGQIRSINQEISALSGYMIMFTPLIAGLALKMGMSGLGSIASSMMYAPQQEAARVARETVQGNYTMGTTSLDNHSYNNENANKHDTNYTDFAGERSWNAEHGSTVSKLRDGSEKIDMSRGVSNAGGLVNIDWSNQIGSKMSSNINNAKSDVERASSDYVKSTSSGLSQALGYNESFSRGNSKYDGFENSLSSDERKSFDDSRSIIDKMSKDYGVSTDDSLRLAIGAKAGIGFDALIANGQFETSVNAGKTGNLREAYSHITSGDNMKRYSESVGKVQNAVNNMGVRGQTGENQEFVDSMRNDFVTSESTNHSLQNAQERATTYSKQQATYKESGERINHNLTPSFVNWLKDTKGTTGAENIMNNGDPAVIQQYTGRFLNEGGLDRAMVGGNTGNSGYTSSDNIMNNKVERSINQGVDASYIKGEHGSNVEVVSGKNNNNTDDLNKKIAAKSAASAWKSEVLQPTKKASNPALKEDDGVKIYKSMKSAQPQNQSTPTSSDENDIKASAAENSTSIPPNIIPDNTPQGKSNQSTTGENAGKFNEDGSSKEIIYKSNYKSTNPFANEIHRGIGKEMTNLENQNNTNQWKKGSELENKESSIISNQNKVKDVTSNKIEQGAGTHMVNSLASNTVNTGKNVITSIANTYNTATGKSENVRPLIKGDKPLFNMEDKDLKLNKDNKQDKGNSTEAKSSNASVNENQNNKSKSGD
jgi:conjugal transfer mating pair stabilization protein TraG